MVYVLNKDGHPLMPTSRHGKVRHLLKQGKAKVVKRTPFTIQLLYDSTNYTQPISLGVDAGSKVIGLSATTNTKELFASNITIRNKLQFIRLPPIGKPMGFRLYKKWRLFL